ncbi:TPA: hypothetical protein JZF81_004633 [Escherichia coli]|nr:hypothetical protein [Escherichia coli]
MKLVQLVFLFFCIVTGEGRAENITVAGQSVNLPSASNVTLDDNWMAGSIYPDNKSAYAWNIRDYASAGDGCGVLCTTLTQSLKTGQTTGTAQFTPQTDEKIVSTDVGNIKIKLNFSNLTFYGLFTINGKQNTERYFPEDASVVNNTTYNYSFNSGLSPVCVNLGCMYSWKTGIVSGNISLFISLPDKLSTTTFTIPQTPVASFTTSLYSQVVDSSFRGDIYVMSSTINIPAITITIPERCYTHLSGDITGNAVTFRTDIDASALTSEGGRSLDSKTIQLTPNCNTKYISKSVHASVKLEPTSGIEDSYKFLLKPRSSTSDRNMSVVAKHLSSGASGATICSNDNNTFNAGKYYSVGQVAFPGQSNGGLKAPYNITFNLCAFATDTATLLAPGEYTGGVRLVTRFYTADQ